MGPMKEKILYWCMMVAGVISLFLYIGTRFLPMMNLILVEKMDLELQEFTKFGDLYYNNCIADFKEDLPEQIRRYRLSDENPEINDADLLTYGDSFFDISFQLTLPERLTDTMNNRVFSYITQDPYHSNPFCLLNDLEYKASPDPKIIIVESAERNIPNKYGIAFDESCNKLYVPYDNFASKLLHQYIFKDNDEQLFNLVLKRSYPTFEIFSWFTTLKFRWYGSISSLTPIYRTSPDPWLFYKNSVDNGPGSFYYQFTSGEIDTYADNIALLSENLKTNYNLELRFMVVPNKYSVYSGLINQDRYNGFIPALQQALAERGVKYVDLYSAFSNSSDILYYGTDTHWNKLGVDKALELTLRSIEWSDLD